MPTARCQIELSVPAEKAWAYAADPSRLGRWWPAVERVDRADDENYTRWIMSPRGRAVPMAFKLEALEPGHKVTWQQQLAGTAFARSVRSSTETIEVVGTETGSTVGLSITRRLKGTARLGGFLVRRGQRRELKAAVENLRANLDG
ncbi:MAG: SRPBCC family protein [Actinomycetes bacterium]